MNVVASIAVALSRMLKRWRERRESRHEIAMLAARGNEHLLKDVGLSRERAQALSR